MTSCDAVGGRRRRLSRPDPDRRTFKSEYSSLVQSITENLAFGIAGNLGADLIRSLAVLYFNFARESGKSGVLRFKRLTTDRTEIEDLEFRFTSAAQFESFMDGLTKLLGHRDDE